MKIPTVSVVAPCFNEAQNLPELVDRLNSTFELKAIHGEIVLVDDGSTDGTKEVLQALKQKYPILKAIHHSKNRGIEGGWASGVAAAVGEYVCLIDADLQNLPEDVYRLLREIKHSNVDLVQGYRSTVGRLKDSRFILSKGLNWILNKGFSMNLRDNKSGFVIGRQEVLQDILRHRYKYRYYQSFITVAAKSKGYSVREIETFFESRLLGRSFIPAIPVRVILFCFLDVLKALFEFRFFPKKDDVVAQFLSEHKPGKIEPKLSGWRRISFEAYFMTMPLHKWMISRKARSYYLELKDSQYLSCAEIKQLQEIKLAKLISHAYSHVAYYRELMNERGLRPKDIRTIEDLQKLPLLSKQNVREHLYFDLLSDNHDKKQILKIQTSGSTGEPFVCYADRHQLEIRWASTQRSLEWTGYRWGDRCARLWHQTLGMSLSQVIREKIDAWFTRRLFIPAYEMSDSNIEKFAKKLRKFKPILIDGYAESFNFLAQYLKAHNLDGVKPKGIVSSAQILPDQSREIIEKSFECGIFDKYGSREFSGIAYECEAHDGHHVVAESYIVEILKDGYPAKPGEMGEVVITDLNNYCLPFIRYRVGDLAVAMDNTQTCSCGRGLPRVGRIEGRVQAIIVTDSGKYIPGTFFAHFFKDHDYVIRQYQVIQEEKGAIQLKIVKALRFDEAIFNDLIIKLQKHLGESTRINVNFVESIEMVRTGKHQGSISRLKIDFQRANLDRNQDEKMQQEIRG